MYVSILQPARLKEVKLSDSRTKALTDLMARTLQNHSSSSSSVVGSRSARNCPIGADDRSSTAESPQPTTSQANQETLKKRINPDL
ncbi:hypothetical protein NPIL_576841 [Nephila pilipes]|uniref:Uncharacterized protein n=1 Tax=Nephila pilipes TaxID=299642 RepID=A0A8X6NC86_NEPPI|nr:hypothetical protein NPIL_576841 [Nephila pilipes]